MLEYSETVVPGGWVGRDGGGSMPPPARLPGWVGWGEERLNKDVWRGGVIPKNHAPSPHIFIRTTSELLIV